MSSYLVGMIESTRRTGRSRYVMWVCAFWCGVVSVDRRHHRHIQQVFGHVERDENRRHLVEPRSFPQRELAFFGDALVELTQGGVLVEVERHLLAGPTGEMDGICQPYPVDAFCTGRDEGGTIEDVGGEILQHTRVLATPDRVELDDFRRGESALVKLAGEDPLHVVGAHFVADLPF